MECKTLPTKSARIRALIIEYRKAKGFTQLHVADAIGVSLNKYQRVETGRANLSFDDVSRLSELYNVDILSEIDKAETAKHLGSMKLKITYLGGLLNNVDRYTITNADLIEFRKIVNEIIEL